MIMTIQISNRMFLNMKCYTTAMIGMKLGQVKAKPPGIWHGQRVQSQVRNVDVFK